jgi:lycopene beta-cyclase
MKEQFQYIIIGAGCAGLQLAKALLDLPDTLVTSVLLIEANEHHQEKSWCFWADKVHAYSHLVQKQWPLIGFNSTGVNRIQNLHPTTYQYIDSGMFAKHHFDAFKSDKRIKVVYQKVLSVTTHNQTHHVTCIDKTYVSDYVFYSHPQIIKKTAAPVLWQHFLGWKIKTQEDVFDTSKAILMDFDLGAETGIRFVYILPFSTNTALIECTIFSSNVADVTNYENTLKNYIEEKITTNYTVSSKEKGQIPMTLSKSTPQNNLIPIGTAAGCIKASTGYSFIRNMQHTAAIIELIRANKKIEPKPFQKKYIFFDSLLIKIITEQPKLIKVIFTKLFIRNSMKDVLRFLDEKTNLWQDIRIFMNLPKLPFLRALISK